MGKLRSMFAVYAAEPNPDKPLDALRVGERPEPEVPDGWVRRQRAGREPEHARPVDAARRRHQARPVPDDPRLRRRRRAAGGPDAGTEVVLHGVLGDASVYGDETLDPQRTLLTEKYQGTFADTVVVPARNVLPKPAELSFSEAACMGTAWLTAYRMLFTKSGLRPGQTMLVQGASGGVSTALVALGKAAGMRVWVTGRSEEKRALAERLGAHQTFESGARLPERVDAVFETVGKATWSHSMRSAKPGGTIVVSGSTSGPDPSADLQRLFFMQLRVVGSTMGTRDELAALLEFCRLNGHPAADRHRAADGRRRRRVRADARRRDRRQDRFHSMRSPCRERSRWTTPSSSPAVPTRASWTSRAGPTSRTRCA